MLNLAFQLFHRDLVLAQRRKAEVIQNFMFFIVVCSLFPFAIGPEKKMLQMIGPGVVWVAALLSANLGLPRLFLNDFHDGSLEQLVISDHPLSVLLLAKITAYWLSVGFPLVVLAPLIGLQFGLGLNENLVLALGLLLGTPILSLIGAIGASLTLGLRNGGVLINLLVLPLYVPVLIFGSGAVLAVQTGLDPAPHLYILTGILGMTLGLAPVAVGFSVKTVFE